MRYKKDRKLLVSLFTYYITFVFVLAAIFVFSYLYLGIRISKSFEGTSRIPIFNIISDEYNDYREIDCHALKTIGGYIEVLDRDRKVIYRDGQVPPNLKDSYTEYEFQERLSGTGDKESSFNVICKSIKVQKDESYLVLIMIPKHVLAYTLKFTGVPYKVGKPLYKLYIFVIGFGVILSIISIIIYSIWTSKRIGKPLEKIDEALGKVIDGDYDKKVTLTGLKEFVVIGDTINYLIDKLKTSREENQRLEESKTHMLMDLSHDIKTPITTIKGFSAALYEGMVEDEEKKKRYYKTIYNKSEHVGELVDELFEFVKLQDTKNILKLESVDICELMRQIVVSYVDEIEEKKFELEVNIPDDILKMEIDYRLFKRAVSNLIENALKYNEEGTKLRVELKEFDDYIKIEIADTGKGIPESIKNNLFEPFVRGDKSRSSDGGSGLGLAIAKKIINNHGGTICVCDGKNGEKTVFSIKMVEDLK
ncbi:Signal transduction histidine kinase [Clostridium sp. DSM 8431]|uniref:sensor histidine kinase n=1 Tax=Clostridium sp. DSM 8431 TaxID=1761781 RepID=UPI0008E31875|nr:HAMP domain-containing sensor histidine kinase [Clostridium sp. DSM 8431]SFU55243.1 Signal transduction histidine kinase [Clostridium sp. DSM 8431]